VNNNFFFFFNLSLECRCFITPYIDVCIGCSSGRTECSAGRAKSRKVFVHFGGEGETQVHTSLKWPTAECNVNDDFDQNSEPFSILSSSSFHHTCGRLRQPSTYFSVIFWSGANKQSFRCPIILAKCLSNPKYNSYFRA
jgi:hypothetical protein